MTSLKYHNDSAANLIIVWRTIVRTSFEVNFKLLLIQNIGKNHLTVCRKLEKNLILRKFNIINFYHKK